MNKKDFIRKARNILVTTATGAVVTSGLTSCDDRKLSNEWEKIHPGATIKDRQVHGPFDNTHYFEADKKTDTLAIKQIKEKYLFQMTQYEQMFDSIIIQQQKADVALLSAAQKGDLTKVQEALEIMGANVNAQDAETGNTAIMIAKEKLPFEKAFLIVKYLVAEPEFNPDVENKDGISIKDMINAEISKGSVAWQSVSRKIMQMRDTTRNRDNTEMIKAIVPLQKAYDNLMSTYGKEMKEALGYHASAKCDPNRFLGVGSGMKIVVNEDGSETKIVRRESVDDMKKMKKIMVSTMSLTGTLELEKLNPQNVDFKLLAKKLTLGKMSIKPENVQDILKNTQKNVIDNQSSQGGYKIVGGRRGGRYRRW